MKHEITVESLAIYDTVAIQEQAQASSTACPPTTGRPTTRPATTRPTYYPTTRTTYYPTTRYTTPPPRVYCYTCAMDRCPLPFKSYGVSTVYSPNGWCIVCDE